MQVSECVAKLNSIPITICAMFVCSGAVTLDAPMKVTSPKMLRSMPKYTRMGENESVNLVQARMSNKTQPQLLLENG